MMWLVKASSSSYFKEKETLRWSYRYVLRLSWVVTSSSLQSWMYNVWNLESRKSHLCDESIVEVLVP